MPISTRLLTLLSLAALALAGCATAPGVGAPPPVARASAPPPADAEAAVSNYGLFLAGEAALLAGQNARAEAYFSRAARGADEADPAVLAMIRQKAFSAAVMAGDITGAAALAPAPDPSSATFDQRLARLVRGVEALADGRGKDADAILSAPAAGASFPAGFQLLKPWAAAAAGDMARATALPEGGAALTGVSAQYDQALLLERARRYAEAEADYKALTSGQFAALYIVPYGEFLQRRGRGKDAQTLLDQAARRLPTLREFKHALIMLSAKTATPMPTLLQGAAQAMTAAAEMSMVEKRFAEAEIYLRLALRLDPQEDEAWVFLGNILTQAGQGEAGRAAYAHVPQSSPDFIDARQLVIASYQQDGDTDTALKLAEDLVRANPHDRESLIEEADLLRAANRFNEAVAVFDTVIAQDPANSDWSVYYERATALDRAGRWPDAERDLTKALSLRPDQPDVLNYLGYSWVNRRERLPQAMAMLQKAYLSQPDSGEIADSLGWAYYSLGDFKQAVQRLERAVSLEPVNAEITDHLGDAYWRAGRQTEARYQWTRVLGLSPTDDLRTAVRRKLAAGLDALPDANATRS
jgi:Flp pilus assembly protein TadD